MLSLLLLLALQPDALAPGRIIDRVTCTADPGQTYALYIPSGYDPKRAWPVIFAFDPGGRGRTPVERYQLAAEKYGYIVAGSNNSRNGPLVASLAAADAMTSDVAGRFSLDTRRVYLAGMSGGSRVALEIARGSKGRIAAVLASSAGFSERQPPTTVPFAIFGTAGTEDFNYLEMRRLDRALTSPHHLAIFEGGHTWLPEATAMAAVEWLELHAMKTGRKPRNEAEIEDLFRNYEASAASDSLEALQAARAGQTDFAGLHDTTPLDRRAATLSKDKKLHDAEKKDRDDLDKEQHLIDELLTAEARLKTDERPLALSDLRSFWKRIDTAANAPEDSLDRRRTRRVRALATGAADRTSDSGYLKLMSQYRRSRTGAPLPNVK